MGFNIGTEGGSERPVPLEEMSFQKTRKQQGSQTPSEIYCLKQHNFYSDWKQPGLLTSWGDSEKVATYLRDMQLRKCAKRRKIIAM